MRVMIFAEDLEVIVWRRDEVLNASANQDLDYVKYNYGKFTGGSLRLKKWLC